MFKKVLFAILCFPLIIIEVPTSLISILIAVLGKLIFALADGKDAYNDYLETKSAGWTELKDSLKFDD